MPSKGRHRTFRICFLRTHNWRGTHRQKRGEVEGPMKQLFERFSSKVASLTGQPLAFMVAIGVFIAWVVSGPLLGWSLTWQLIINTCTTVVTFLMVFVIQNAENRDASAMQAKLDELLRAVRYARNEFIGVEHLSEEELHQLREDLDKLTSEEAAERKAIERLLSRRH
jgi:low affinity Fe/Cu permease